jgi:hypothetical protein
MELPDFTRGFALYGNDGSGYIPVMVDTNGNILAVLKGWDGAALQTLLVDSDGNLNVKIKGTDGSDLKTLKTDTDGNLLSLMKASFSGTLKTVACDTDGRIIMIPTDPADIWGSAINVGNAELAARLKSSVQYHRSGRTHIVEDFSNGLNRWQIATSGTGANVLLTIDTFESVGYSVRLKGGSTASKYARIEKKWGLLPQTGWGIAAAIALEQDIDIVRLGMYVYDGSDQKYAAIQFDRPAEEVLYYSSGGAWTKLDDWAYWAHDPDIFNHVKITFDTTTDKFLTLWENDISRDMSAISFYSTAFASTPYIKVEITVFSQGVNNGMMYVDDVVISSMES